MIWGFLTAIPFGENRDICIIKQVLRVSAAATTCSEKQPRETFTCSNSTIKTLERGMKYVLS